MKKFFAFFVSLALLLGCGAAYAAPAAETGYIVELVPGAVMPLSETEGVTRLGGGFLAVEDAAALAELAAAGLVAHVEEDAPMYLLTTNDPYYSDPGQLYYQWYLDAVHAYAAWEKEVDLSRITVAVVDSGIIAAHEDMENVLTGVDFTSEVYSENTRDNMGHGTAVAGIIAAVRGNGLGIAGIAHGVRILPLKVFSNENKTDLSLVVGAIHYAVDQDVDVINLSVGGEDYSYALEAAVDRAVDAGIIVVASAGNGGTALMYPAALDNVVGVGFVDAKLEVSGSSTRNESVFVSAPGEQLTSLGSVGYSRYCINSGSSFAAPVVSAAAAYCKAIDPDMDAADFMELLRTTAADLGDAGYDTGYGHGLIDFSAMMEVLLPVTSTEVGMERVDIGEELVTVRFEAEGETLSAPAQAAVAAENAYKDVLLRGSGFAVTIPAGHIGSSSVMDYVPDVGNLSEDSVAFCEAAGGVHAVGASLVRDGVLHYVACCHGTYYAAANAKHFTDAASHWGAAAIGFVSARELFNGVGGGIFAPDGTMDRAMLVTVLSRLACASGAESVDFTDVAEGKWYASAVAWAAASGVTTGYGDGTFRPENPVSRVEAVTMLQRFAALSGVDTSSVADGISAFPDGEKAPTWSVDALNWALEQGLLTGRDDGTLDPTGTATRAELAAILTRYIENVIFA